MKKTPLFFFMIISALILSCGENKKSNTDNDFVLKGEVKGIKTNTWIYLIFEDESVDSTQIVDGKFTLKGSLEHPKEYELYIENSQNYTNVWLESGEINFEAKDGEFEDAIINGSNAHKDSERLWDPIWEYRKRRDSLSQVIASKEIADSLKLKAQFQFEIVMQNRLKIEKDFIQNNPDSYVSAQTLDFYSTSFSRDQVSELYENFSQEIKESSYGISIKRFLELNKNLKVGDQYVDFSMPNWNGETIKVSKFEGNLILLDFWASWCGPCIEEYPALKSAYSKFHKDGFEIVSISEDQSKERWLTAIEKNELNWINLWQEDGNKADAYLIYGINGIPDNFLIDENGTIVARNLRGERLISEIQKHIQNKTRS